jgi:hypothetical protein
VLPAATAAAVRAQRDRAAALLLEPVLGEVHVVQVANLGYDEVRHRPLVQVHWIDDAGLNSAACAYPAQAPVTVRRPAAEDRLLIRRGIDQARYHRRDVDPSIARLIAAHLSRGPATGLYRFAVTGAIDDRVRQELEEAGLNARTYIRSWADSLARYCQSRSDDGPLPGWAAERW